MSPELLQHVDRRPAIDPSKLCLPSGEYANKYTLQRLAYEAGLPVPKILTLEEANREDEYYCRGYFDHCVDLWAVDTTWTGAVRPHEVKTDDWWHQNPEDEYDTDGAQGFLRRNFDVKAHHVSKVFYQQKVDMGSYVSFMTRGNELFCTWRSAEADGGVNWLYFVDHVLKDVGENYLLDYESQFQQFFPLIQNAISVFNKALGGDFEYKFDFLSDIWSESQLIQSRVVSPKYTNEIGRKHREQLSKLQDRGIPVMEVNMKHLELVNQKVDKGPFIMNLRNRSWSSPESSEVIHALDLRNMQGLILPEHLRGGLLEHGGYSIIAYAMYWGLPISIGDN